MRRAGGTLPRCLAALLLAAPLLAGCSSPRQERIDGSSTVYPISLAVTEEYLIDHPEADMTVAFSGTGGGFTKFCRGETVINDASRVIKPTEIEECAERGVGFIELPVAYDALTVVVSRENEWARCLTLAELRELWRPDSPVRTWSDLRPGWPEEPIELFAPGADSGSFDYFTSVVTGASGASRTDYFPSEDDNVLALGVAANRYALGYFGYPYYTHQRSALRAVAIDAGAGCVEPTPEAIFDGRYTPLTRPLFIYVSLAAVTERPQVADYVRYYLSPAARDYIAQTGYPLLEPEAYELALERFEARATGPLFGEADGTVLEVLRSGSPR